MAKRVADFKLQIEVQSILFLLFCSVTFSFLFIFISKFDVYWVRDSGPEAPQSTPSNFFFVWLFHRFLKWPARPQPRPTSHGLLQCSIFLLLRTHPMSPSTYISRRFLLLWIFFVFLEKRMVLVMGSLISWIVLWKLNKQKYRQPWSAGSLEVLYIWIFCYIIVCHSLLYNLIN